MDQIASVDWTQTYTIIVSNIAVLGVVIAIIVWMTNKLDGDIKASLNRIDSVNSRLDATNNRLDGHAQRMDQLYCMFIDLVKEKK